MYPCFLLDYHQKGKGDCAKKWPLDYPDVKAKGLYPLEKDKYLLITTNGVKWYNFKTNKIEKSILDSISFRTYYKDSQGRIWLGSDGNGAFMYSDNKVYKLPLGPLNAFKTIHDFIDDHKGHFWLPTNNGLYRISIQKTVDFLKGDRPQFNYYALDNKDGLPTNEFNGGAKPGFQWLSNGELVLPSMHGLVKFNPDSLSFNVPKHQIYIDALKVDSMDLIFDSEGDIIKLAPNFNHLEIKVSCPYFGNPRNLILAYQIISADERTTWTRLPASGLLNINRLPAGKYQILIKKVGYDATSSGGVLRLPFEVLPYFYNTWWFYLLMLLLFALTGYVISRRRIAALKRKNIEIEKIVNVRTSELMMTTDKLIVSQEALEQSNKVKEQIIAMILHDLRSPVRFLGTISQHLIGQFTHRSSQESLEDLKKLNKSIGSLWSFIEQFFGWAVHQKDAFKVTVTAVDIQDVFKEVDQFYNEILSYNGNILDIEASNLRWNTDKNILNLIIRNLVDNANKFTESGKIWIYAKIMDDQLQICVKDTGRGLTPRQVKQYMDAANSKNTEGNGNGSVMILQMLGKIGGRLTIQTTKDTGSLFTIWLNKLPLTESDVSFLQTDT